MSDKSSKPRYLTKSRFKVALECPTKLFYLEKHKNYASSMLDNPFLEALARGGFQVGELAKYYYPNGVDIKSLDYEESFLKTKDLLRQENITIYEAAIKFKNLFIRIDILKKTGNVLELIEVKSKTFNPKTFLEEIWDKNLLKKNTYGLKSDWLPYIYDIAFQGYVLKNAYPQFKIKHYLMCADKTKAATVDGLNQKFRIAKDDNNRTKIIINGSIDSKSLGDPILTAIDIDDAIAVINKGQEYNALLNDGKTLEDKIKYFAEIYEKDQKVKPIITSDCKSCEYRKNEAGKNWGFGECLIDAKGFTKDELNESLVFDVWNLRTDNILQKDKLLINEMDEQDLTIKSRDDGTGGLSNSERQWEQIKMIQEGRKIPYIDTVGLKTEFDKFKYPLNMIDFETMTNAIPFYKGQRPYEQVAFQFSHHVVYEDGKVEHRNEFISTVPGKFPNFEFVRNLKGALSENEGTIFRYSHHENTVLNQIYEQLEFSNEPDKTELQKFIREITYYKADGKNKICGPRCMVDIYDLVLRFYYSPLMGKSNSIKYVLPAVLNESEFLKEKYSKKNYFSKNFPEFKCWIEFNTDGSVKDPYQQLPPMFSDSDIEKIKDLISDEDDDVNNGGAAMTAYALTQFTIMSDEERKRIHEALLRYCELDTLAMVMIVEYWRECIDILSKSKRKIS